MYVKTSTSTVESENGKTKYIIPLSENFVSEFIDVTDSRVLSFRIYSAGANGSGTLTLKYSQNNVNYETVLDSSNASVEWTIDGTDTDGFDYTLPREGFYRFEYNAGTNTEGTMSISFTR